MFYYIEGIVSLIDNGIAVVDCGGVGYAVNTTTNSLSRVHTGEKARFYICTIIRDNSFDLFGFITPEEKHAFELLTGVSGVGPKAAQAILSSNTPEALSLAILSGNEKALTVVPGIGKKIAQRVLLELKDKFSDVTDDGSSSFGNSGYGSSGSVGSDKRSDAAAALAVLGYGGNEIASALRDIDMQTLSIEDIVRQALKKMVK